MKKTFAAFFTAVFLISAHVAGAAPLATQAPPVPPVEQTQPAVPSVRASTIADVFAGERMVYRIGFWFFDNVAEGSISLEKEADGTYTGTLEAHTTGSVRRIILDRKDTYVSRMRLSEDGQRFIPVGFEKTVDKNGKVRRGTTVFDYEKHVMTWKSWGGGKEERGGEVAFPEDITPYDPVTAFYNLRYGVYGPLEKGKEFTIYSFPKEDRVPRISVRIATEDEMGRMPEPVADKAAYLAFARIDKELFGSTSGDIEIYFTGEMVPVYAVAKDILFFGDIRGTLTRSVAGGVGNVEKAGSSRAIASSAR